MLSYVEASRLSMAVDDPDGEVKDDRPLDLPISEEMVSREYYRPFRAWRNHSEHVHEAIVDGRTYLVRAEPEFDFVIRLDADHYGSQRRAESMAENMPERRPHDSFVGRDGVLVQLDPNWRTGGSGLP